jgi:nucleotide-binding universal stress UspA family protein
MFENVVVGVDEHQGGRDAIALAKHLAAKWATVRLAHIYAAAPARGSSGLSDRAEHDRWHGLLAAAREEADIEARLTCVPSSSAGRGLHQVAEVKRADLLVVGSSRRGLLGRVLLGDDTHAALNGAPCAVAIAPAGYAQEPVAMREIGVGYNGSPESRHALEFAARLANEHGAKLSAFEAVSLPTYLFAGGPAPVDLAIEDLVKDARERVAALEGVEPHAAYGHPSEELALYSASLDLLVVGSRDYGPLGRTEAPRSSSRGPRAARCWCSPAPRAPQRPRTCPGRLGGRPRSRRAPEPKPSGSARARWPYGRAAGRSSRLRYAPSSSATIFSSAGHGGRS